MLVRVDSNTSTVTTSHQSSKLVVMYEGNYNADIKLQRSTTKLTWNDVVTINPNMANPSGSMLNISQDTDADYYYRFKGQGDSDTKGSTMFNILNI